MKVFLFLVAGFVFSTIGYASTVGFDSFTARADGDAIVIEWKSQSETGLKSYTVERSDVRFNDFEEAGTVPATGSNSYYKFRDSHPSSAPLAGQTSGNFTPTAELYKYRIRMNYANEVSYSWTVTASRPSSGVRRTWGMIKELFH